LPASAVEAGNFIAQAGLVPRSSTARRLPRNLTLLSAPRRRGPSDADRRESLGGFPESYVMATIDGKQGALDAVDDPAM
jgi:hypothetical protein